MGNGEVEIKTCPVLNYIGEKNKGKLHILIKPLLEIGAPPVVVQRKEKPRLDLEGSIWLRLKLFSSEGKRRGASREKLDVAISGHHRKEITACSWEWFPYVPHFLRGAAVRFYPFPAAARIVIPPEIWP